MAADVNLGSPTRHPGSDEIHNSGGVLAEGEPGWRASENVTAGRAGPAISHRLSRRLS